MTDEQIIKVLRCSREDANDYDNAEVCDFLDNVIDLINRLRAKNEREINQIKSEAIKEFAKYIIDKSQNGIIQVSDIPDYVKEMTEARK